MDRQEKYRWDNKGTRQTDRMPEELSADYVMIDGRSFNDLVAQVSEYASRVSYYETATCREDGDWTAFFSDIYDYENHRVNVTALEEMTARGDVAPHLSLLLAFLKLYRIQQDNLNRITGRHLDFYYKDILGFQPKKGTSGNICVEFELNKNVDRAFVAKGTLFEAGKDKNGKNIRYEAVDDLSVNKIKISSAHCIDRDGGISVLPVTGTPSSGPVKQTSPDGSVPAAISEVTCSLYISSEILECSDGTMTITLYHGLNTPVILNDADFTVEITGTEGWEPVTWNQTSNGMEVKAPVIPYDKAVHGGCLETKYPVIRISSSNYTKFCRLHSSVIRKIMVKVEGSTNFMIENRNGTFLNRAGLLPFGTVCAVEDWFKIRLPFEDRITESSVAIQWKEDTYSDYSEICRMINKCIKYHKTSRRPSNSKCSSCPAYKGKYNLNSVWNTEEGLDSQMHTISRTGLLYSLNFNVFNQEEYAKKLSVAIPKASKPEDLPSRPFIPEFKSPASISYSSADTGKLVIQADTPVITEKISNAVPGTRIKKALSFARYPDNHAGTTALSPSMLIELDGVSFQDILSIYFSINPYYKFNGPTPLIWSCLVDGEWVGISESSILKDSTDGLRHSGIIVFSLPENLDADDGKAWLKLTDCNVEGNQYDFTNIREMHTQALELKYSVCSAGDEPIGVPLPAGTVTKSTLSIPGVKKINQPYIGGSGSCDETDSRFMCRVSETLRHKGRGWTGWDYERLLLEKFPGITAVKCLSCCNSEGGYEPGCATLLLLPGTDEIAQNKLAPVFDEVMLSEANRYLKQISSSQVEAVAVNPVYVPVKVSASVHLKKGYNDDEYYMKLLNECLTNYLAPWCDGVSAMEFTTDLNETNVIDFLDGLYFVDYVVGTEVYAGDTLVPEGAGLQPDNPVRILTSVVEHDIKII